jgi:CDP-glycerol glycerophosphotransferase (TagB/SpsB family)
VANEYLLLDRPLIYLAAPDYERRYGDTIDLRTWGFSAGPLVQDGGMLNVALTEALDRPQDYSEIRQRMASHLFYNPGQATQKAVNVIKELLNG